MMRRDGLRLAAFIYLYLPALIFVLTWMKWFIAVPAVAVAVYPLAVLLLSEKREPRKRSPLFISLIILSFVLCLLWCASSGIGGFTLQSGDFPKHNIILKDLIFKDWPVKYSMRGEEGFLSYYIGAYIVPALFGKAVFKASPLGNVFDRAQDMMLIWTALGIFLSLLILFRHFESKAGEKAMGRLYKTGALLIVILFVLVMFSPFLTPISGIFSKWYPDEAADGVHWLSDVIWIQYSSDITLLAYVFPQYVSGLLAVSLFMDERRGYDKWGLILAPLILCSAFVFLGMSILMLSVYLLDFFAERKAGHFNLKIFSKYNICSLVFALILLMYLFGNITQEKPASAGMGVELIDYYRYVHTLFFFELSWLLWIPLIAGPLVKKEAAGENRDKAILLLAVSINLFIYPFFKMGYYNDLCMRASIPALSVLCVLAAERLLGSLSEKNWLYALSLTVCLLLSAAGPLSELHYFCTGRDKEARNYYELYETSEDFFYSYDFLKYQYVDFNPDGISGRILK